MKQQKQQKEYGKKFFVPILLILAVLPLITNAHIGFVLVKMADCLIKMCGFR